MSTEQENAAFLADQLKGLVEALRRSRQAGMPRQQAIDGAVERGMAHLISANPTRDEALGALHEAYRALVAACYELGRHR